MEDDNNLDRQSDSLATGLAWFSIALGVSELVMPDKVADLAGLPRSSAPTLRALGAREIGHGISILASPGRPTPVWSRVAGDAIDLAVMLSAFRSDESIRTASRWRSAPSLRSRRSTCSAPAGWATAAIDPELPQRGGCSAASASSR